MKLNRIHTLLFNPLGILALIEITNVIQYNNYHDYKPNSKGASGIISFDYRIDRADRADYAGVVVRLPGTCFDISGEGENDRDKT